MIINSILYMDQLSVRVIHYSDYTTCSWIILLVQGPSLLCCWKVWTTTVTVTVTTSGSCDCEAYRLCWDSQSVKILFLIIEHDTVSKHRCVCCCSDYYQYLTAYRVPYKLVLPLFKVMSNAVRCYRLLQIRC